MCKSTVRSFSAMTLISFSSKIAKYCHWNMHTHITIKLKFISYYSALKGVCFPTLVVQVSQVWLWLRMFWRTHALISSSDTICNVLLSLSNDNFEWYQLLSSTTITLNGKFSLIWWTTDCLDQQFIGNTWCSTEEIRLEFPGISTLGSHSGSSLWNLQENATTLTEFFSDNNTSKSTAVLCFTDSFNSF